MAIEIKIDKALNNNYMQVKVTEKRYPERFFKVPKDKVDEFCNEYKKNNKNTKIITNSIFIAAAFAGSAIANLFAGKIKNSSLRTTIGVIGGLIAGMGALQANLKTMNKRHDKLLNKFDAEQIFFEDKKNIIDIISKTK